MRERKRSGYDPENDELILVNEYDPFREFSHSELGRILSLVPDHFDIIFGYDISKPDDEVRAIYLRAKGSAEIGYLRLDSPEDPRFMMDLSRNELYDPKEEGIIHISYHTHRELAYILDSIAWVLHDRNISSD